jgi:hypothetical protein
VLEYCTGSFCDPVQTHAVTQFALWAVMGAPLLLSFDVRSLTPTEISRVYGNPEIIAINQVRCEFRSWIPLMCAHARTHARSAT